MFCFWVIHAIYSHEAFFLVEYFEMAMDVVGRFGKLPASPAGTRTTVDLPTMRERFGLSDRPARS